MTASSSGCGADVDSTPATCCQGQSRSHDSASSYCNRSSLYSPGQEKGLLREEWAAAPLLYESVSGPPSKAIIYISHVQPEETTPFAPGAAAVLQPRPVRLLPRPRRGVVFLTLTAALLPLLLFKIFLMGIHQYHYASFGSGQDLGSIQVIKRHRQQSAVKDLSMEIAPRVTMHPSVSAPALLRIPRLIHQMYHGRARSSAGPTYVSRNLLSPGGPQGQIAMGWRNHNGHAWEHRFYDDDASLSFVESEYPEYLDAYQLLQHAPERADFFRYLVILKYGGVYADIDVECRKPLDGLLKPGDSMVVGWDTEVASDEEAQERGLVRRRQVLQWFFAAAPHHPALREICDVVAGHIRTALASAAQRDSPELREALELTGPGVWTDIILRYALQAPSSAQGAVRILPRAVFAESPRGMDGLPASNPTLVHHLSDTSGSWMDMRRLFYIQNWLALSVTRLFRREGLPTQPAKEPLLSSGVSLFPVSVSFEPSFVMMVDLIGQGDMQAGSDVGAAITNWGAWQAGSGSALLRQPTVVEALVGSLTSHLAHAALVDVGAGQGFFSLAAAASGHTAVSFEASSPSLAALRASISHNSFGSLIDVHEVPLGAKKETVCLRRKGEAGRMDAEDVNVRRGYGIPAVHAVPEEACEQMAQRSTLSDQLVGSSVGSLRLSANGWEGWILQGAEHWLRGHPPATILIEFSPLLMEEAGYQDPVQILHQLDGLGYTHVAHAGRLCEERWRQLNPPGPPGPAHAAPPPAHQPTWCQLKPEAFHLMSSSSMGAGIENVLFVHSSHSKAGGRAVHDGQEVHLRGQLE